MERKTRAQSESLAFLMMVIAGMVLVNLLAVRFFGRVDLTARKLFTLSDGTRRIVDRLHDQLTVTVYFTENQPPPANDDERFLRDQLDEYRSISHGRVSVHVVRPDNDQRRRDADTAGCTKQPIQAVDARAEQATMVEAYRCVVFEYLGQREKIAFLPPGVEGLEYEISSIVKRMVTPEADRSPNIGFLTGHGELTPEEGMQYLPQVLEQFRSTFHPRTVNLNNGEATVPTDIKGLIIVNPTRRIEERELRRLDEYLMHGGSIAVFGGGLTFPSTDAGSATGTAAEHHLNDWLDGYGLHLESDAVLDPRSSNMVAPISGRPVVLRLVTWPEVQSISGEPSQNDLRTQGGLDPSFPPVFRLPSITTPYPSSLTVNDNGRRQAGGSLQIFARTSPLSIRRTSDFGFNIIEILQDGARLFEGASQHGPYVLGAALTGRFRSAFAGHPPAPPAGGAAALPATSVPERAERDARLLVLSTGSFLALEPLQQLSRRDQHLPANLVMLVNTFDWLSQDMDLLAVRAKDTADPQLRSDISDKAKLFFKWGAIVVLPLAIGALGLLLTTLRRNRRREYSTLYGSAAR